MFPNFNKNNKKIKNKVNRTNIDKNLKMMSISAIVLIVLFLYTITKSDNIIHGSSYYVGVGFLFVLLILTFALQKYKDKIRAIIPKTKFSDELSNVQENSTSEPHVAKEKEIDANIIPTTSSITFNDVAGIQEIKEEL